MLSIVPPKGGGKAGELPCEVRCIEALKALNLGKGGGGGGGGGRASFDPARPGKASDGGGSSGEATTTVVLQAGQLTFESGFKPPKKSSYSLTVRLSGGVEQSAGNVSKGAAAAASKSPSKKKDDEPPLLTKITGQRQRPALRLQARREARGAERERLAATLSAARGQGERTRRQGRQERAGRALPRGARQGARRGRANRPSASPSSTSPHC